MRILTPYICESCGSCSPSELDDCIICGKPRNKKESADSAEAKGGSLKQPCYAAAWPDRCEEMRRYGLMHGMLQGLRYCVDQETRAKIDHVLAEIEKPHNGEVSEPAASGPRKTNAAESAGSLH